jgi:uncharacterized protein
MYLAFAVWRGAPMTHSMMIINVERLDEEPRELSLPLDADWIAGQLGDLLHDGGRREGAAELQVVRTGAKVQVTGTLQAVFSVPCGRCLEPAEMSVNEPFVMVFERVSGPVKHPAEKDLTEEDICWERFEGTEIDLAPYLREPLILAIPMTPLCRPDCPGLLAPGAQEPDSTPPIDPRWKALANLKPTR